MQRLSALLCTGVSVLTLATPAFGQANPPQATPDVINQEQADTDLVPAEEIVVTARRRTESVQDVPQTVNVVTAEQVEKLNLRNFRDIQEIVPGLTMQTAASFSNRATVRGIAFVPEASGNNPSVEFYLNDAPAQSQALFQTTFDFGQFELQRGPQGTLRGRAAPSGSIAVTTRRPDLNEIGMTFNGSMSGRGANKFEGALNIPVIGDVLAFRLAGVIDEDEGNRVRTIKEETQPLLNREPYNKSRAIRGSVRFEPTEWIAANVMYQALHRESHSHTHVASESLFTNTPRTTRLIEVDDYLSLDDQGAYDRADQQWLIGNLDVRFAGQRASYVGSWFQSNYASIGGGDAADFFAPPRINVVERPHLDPAGAYPACALQGRLTSLQATTGAFYQCTSGKATRKTHELRLASEERIAGIFDYVVGALYDHNVPITHLTSQTPVISTQNPVTGAYTITNISLTPIIRDAESTEKSVFGNLTAHIGKLELSGGLRHIKYKDRGDTIVSGVSRSPSEDKYNATIYTASVKYNFTPDFMVYALTGSSWRPGPRVVGNFSLGPNGAGQTARELRFTNLPPERSKSYEVGLKNTFMDGRGRFNVSAFYQKFKNYPFRVPPVPFLSYNVVSGQLVESVDDHDFVAPVPVTVKGIEAEASFQITDRWSIGGNAAYADGQIKNGTIPCLDLNRDGIPDEDPGTITTDMLRDALEPGETVGLCTGLNQRSIESPKFSANIQSEAGFPVTESLEAFLRGSFSFYGKTSGSPTTTFDDRPAYGLLNLFAGVRDPDGAWAITAFARNIFDKRFVTPGTAPLSAQVRQGRNTLVYTSEYRGVNVSAPREFGIQARMAIGSR